MVSLLSLLLRRRENVEDDGLLCVFSWPAGGGKWRTMVCFVISQDSRKEGIFRKMACTVSLVNRDGRK
jgi:hypothetical protein